MLVVPLEKDVITTKDGLVYTVVEYTNFKDGGPAVYCKTKGTGDKTLVLVYFFDVSNIDGVRVDYKKNSHVFQALGRLKRSIHLPQPDDKITLGDGEPVKVEDLKLKSKAIGISKGLLAKATDGEFYRLKNITAIDRALGDDSFDRAAFLALYKDYLGV